MTKGVESPYELLRGGILRLDFVPGERLSERGLEQVLGASRTPIRAALMRLETEGLTRRTDRGWQVTPIDLAEVRAVAEYREAVEGAVAALAVQRASDDELAALAELARRHDERDDEEAGVRGGDEFHLALAALSGNAFLVQGMRDVLTRLSRTRWLDVRTAASRESARDEHLAIVAALRSRDADHARALVLAHGRGTRDRILTHLTEEHRRLRGRGFAIVETAP
ncbi:GntR family transcriptional regulator [Herbiconiux liangxiaofengii]|uniref:GntR family transcriptional regulator n=1 Tax=Herbiconiux liangxiaofengii TaxID=3342795 RepID=UPI0035B7A244